MLAEDLDPNNSVRTSSYEELLSYISTACQKRFHNFMVKLIDSYLENESIIKRLNDIDPVNIFFPNLSVASVSTILTKCWKLDWILITQAVGQSNRARLV